MTQYISGKPTVNVCSAPLGKKLINVRLSFNGNALSLHALKLTIYPAKSGGTSKNYEPIPKGKYWINPAELWSRGFKADAFACIAGILKENESCSTGIDKHRGAWGNYRIAIHPYPGTKVGSRGGFFIHGGNTFGSAGCIDLASGMSNFVSDLKEAIASTTGNCYIDLVVK